jgi:hypothetical protein
MASLPHPKVVSLDTDLKDSSRLSAIFEAIEEGPLSNLSHPQIESQASASTQIETASRKTKSPLEKTATTKSKLTTHWMRCCGCPTSQIFYPPAKKTCSYCFHVQASLIFSFIPYFVLGPFCDPSTLRHVSRTAYAHQLLRHV